MGFTFDIRGRQDDTTGHKLESVFFEGGIVDGHMAVRVVLGRCGSRVCVDRHFTVVSEKTGSRDRRDLDTWTNDVWRVSCKPHSPQWSALVVAFHNLYSSVELKYQSGRHRGSYLPLGRPMFALG